MHVLVTGGAGYIGSHMVRALLRTGHKVTVVDDLSSGSAAAVPRDVEFIETDVRDRERITRLLRDRDTGAVFHFASRIQVGESVVDPRLYWRDNLAAGITLLESVLDAKVSTFVLSSTAAVYGDPRRVPLDEEHPLAPVNPYGATKLALERVLADYARAYGIRYAALRYFNAAGADPEGGIGERHDPETHLIPIVLDVALQKRAHVTVYGDDYPTADGTCIRDYVHVCDLADAHLAALGHLQRGGDGGAFNLGTGKGHSVREVIEVAERVTGRKIPLKLGLRRAGDAPVLVASPLRAQETFAWRAKRPDLEAIVRDAWKWHQRTHAETRPP